MEKAARDQSPTAVTLLLVCALPAVAEELFFRYLAYGPLRRASRTRRWVTAVVLAVAHVYNPLGPPYPSLCGAVPEYFRAAGGLPHRRGHLRVLGRAERPLILSGVPVAVPSVDRGRPGRLAPRVGDQSPRAGAQRPGRPRSTERPGRWRRAGGIIPV